MVDFDRFPGFMLVCHSCLHPSSAQDTDPVNQHFYIQEILFSIVMTFTKLSLLWFYHRIFLSKRFRIVWTCLAIGSVLWCIGSVAAMIFACRPIHAFWDKSVDGSCVDFKTLMFSITAPNVCLDLMLLVLPLIPLWKLKLDRPRKVALMSILLLGGL